MVWLTGEQVGYSLFRCVGGIPGESRELTVRPLGAWKGSPSDLRPYNTGSQGRRNSGASHEASGGGGSSLVTPGGRPFQEEGTAVILVVEVGGSPWNHGG